MVRFRILFLMALFGGCSQEEAPEPEPEFRPAPLVESTRPPRGPKAPDILLRAVSQDALLCVHFPDLGRAAEQLGTTVYGSLASALDLDGIVARLEPLYKQLCSAPNLSTTVPLPWDDVAYMLRCVDGEIILALLDIDGFDRRYPDVRAVVGVTVHGAGEYAAALLTLVTGTIEASGSARVAKHGDVWQIRTENFPWVIELAVDADMVLLGIGADTLAPAIGRLRDADTPFDFSVAKRSFHAEDLYRLLINADSAYKRYTSLASKDVREALESLRFSRVRSISAGLRIVDQNFELTTAYDAPGGHDLLTRLLSANPVSYAMLERIPPGADSFTLFTLNPSWLLKNLLVGLPPTQAAKVTQALEEMKESGIDLSDDLLASIGPQCAHVGLRSDNHGRTPQQMTLDAIANSAWIVQVSNAQALRALFEKHARRLPPGRRYRIRDVECITFPVDIPMLEGVAPSIALSDEFLYVALSENALKAVLASGNAKSAAEYRKLIDCPQQVASVTFDRMSSPGLLLGGFMAGLKAMRESGMPNAARIHDFAAAMQKLSPARSYTTTDENGILSHTISPTGGMSGLGGVTGLAIVSSIAIPNLLRARIAANETAAIATLATIRSAQERYRTMGLSDRDEDKQGEYGYIIDLMHPIEGEPLMPTYPGAGGRYLHAGYLFRSFLPNREGKPIGETSTRSPDVHANMAEKWFVAIAWPVEPGKSGNRTFFLNTHGEIFFCADGKYGGRNAPAPDTLSFEPDNITSRPIPNGAEARDGNRWFHAR